MKSIDEYVEAQKIIAKDCFSKYFADLLYLNYQFKDKDCYETNAEYILGETQDHLLFTSDEMKEIFDNGIELFEEKYNMTIKNYDNLTYEERN